MENVYVGLRYVPKFDGDWDNTKTYEPLMIVTYQGNSYTSRTFVPTGIEITNEEYWALTGNYNAQVEAYRQETRRVSDALGLKPYLARYTDITPSKTMYESLIGGNGVRIGDLYYCYVNKKMSYWTDIRDNYQELKTIATEDYVSSELSSLHTTIQGEIGNAVTPVTSALNSLKGDLKFVSKKNMKIAVVSDSWGKGNNGSGGFFENRFENLLGVKLDAEIYDCSLGGAGILRKVNGMNLRDYVNSLPLYDGIDLVVFIGGYNDWAHINDPSESYTYNDVYVQAQGLLADIGSKFPNAKIIWGGMNMKCHNLNADFWTLYSYINNVPLIVPTTRPVIRMTNWLWALVGKEGYYISEGNNWVHPSESGHQIIANSIVQAVYGGDNNYWLSLMPSQRDSYVFSGATRVSGWFEAIQTNDEITVHFPVISFASEQSGTTIQSAITLPQVARPYSTQVVTCYTGATSFDCVCSILETGVMYLKRTNGSAFPSNTNIYIPDIKFKIFSNT